MKFVRYFISTLFIALTSLHLCGCATNAATNQMTIVPTVPHKIKNQSFLNNINVRAVSGGHETNPLWSSQINNANFKVALENSLRYANLYRDSDAKYILDVDLIKLKQPFAGFNFTVQCQAHYRLMNAVSNKILLDKDIFSTYTAKFNDSLYGVTRLKMANEGAARANINEFIQDLFQLY